jgi:hypothetical protein
LLTAARGWCLILAIRRLQRLGGTYPTFSWGMCSAFIHRFSDALRSMDASIAAQTVEASWGEE